MVASSSVTTCSDLLNQSSKGLYQIWHGREPVSISSQTIHPEVPEGVIRMAIMKIRGGDLDLVEYEFNSFNSGEDLRFVGLQKPYQLTIGNRTVRVCAPARIHLTVLDMNRFAPDHPGGGGMGFAISLYCTVEVTPTDGETVIDYNRPAIIKHFCAVFSKTVGYNGGFIVKARDHEHQHVGLGSTSCILISLAKAINHAVGDPLTDDDLRQLIGHNYVEETGDGKIAFGFETGVGPAASLYGGMAIMGDMLTIVHHHPFGEGKKVFIVIPPTSISSAGQQEFELLMNRARTLDYRDREQKAYCILMDFIPALGRDDLVKMGNIMWEIEFRGSKRAEVEHHSFELYHYMHRLRKAGLEFVGMSSVGPSIAIITGKQEDEVRDIVNGLGLTVAITTTVQNTGLVMESL